jgi:hypothetical protein
VIDTIKEVCSILAKPLATVQEVAVKLGKLVRDQGGSLPLIVQPRDPAFTKALVTRQFDSQQTAAVILTPANSADLTVQALQASFGNYIALRSQIEDMAPRIQFYLGDPAKVGSTSVIATLTPDDWEDTDRGTVSELTIQAKF